MKNIAKYIVLLVLMFVATDQLSAQQFAVKTNALYWATTTPNLGIEFAVNSKITVDINSGFNPWRFSDKHQLKAWYIQPEARWWLCKKYAGHFFGINGGYADYKTRWNYPTLYDGNLYSLGLSYGYSWMLSKRWNLEVELGLGYTHLKYKKKHIAETCNSNFTREMFGPNKLAVSFSYILF